MSKDITAEYSADVAQHDALILGAVLGKRIAEQPLGLSSRYRPLSLPCQLGQLLGKVPNKAARQAERRRVELFALTGIYEVQSRVARCFEGNCSKLFLKMSQTVIKEF